MTAAPPPPAPSRRHGRAGTVVLFLLLAGWLLFLRWPSFGATEWNVDEAIHAAVARTLLDGGVLYRDAVDQRTPLTYYAVAGLFRLFGENNLWALRAAVAVTIAATALGTFLLGRRAQGTGAGVWSAVVLCAFTTNLLYFADDYAVNTEWFVILFTTWGMWWFWRTLPRADWRATVPVGALFGLAFLSKQPGLLDLAAPVATLAYLAATGRRPWADAARSAAGIALGFLAVVAATVAWFSAHGAFGDFVFYTGTYNLLYYGAGVTAGQRLLLAFVPFERMGQHYPLLLAAVLAAAVLLLFRVAQARPTETERTGQPWAFHLLLWNATALAAAVSGGRRFEHYFIQCLPPLALAAGWVLAGAGSLLRRQIAGGRLTPRTAFAAAPLLLLLGGASLNLVVGPVRSRSHPRFGGDSAEQCSRFVRRLTTPAERIFAWGFNPDIYLYTDRRPASRFVYCTFQTGLIPWTNAAPGRDTRDTIVPGAMAALLADLDARRPAFFVDCSITDYRNFAKYPLEKFPALQTFVRRNYLEVDPGRFLPQGYGVYLIRDRARLAPVRLAGGPAGRPAVPEILGPPLVAPASTGFQVAARDPDGRLQRLELQLGDTLLDSVSFQPTHEVTIRFRVPFDRLGPGQYRLVARAVTANGATRDSGPLVVTCAASAVPRDQLPKYGLPDVTTTLVPLTVRAPFAPSVTREEGHRVIALHAPSLLSFALPDDVRRVTGGFGIRPGAYAPENRSPTDGAEFYVEWVSKDEERHVLLHRWLQPRDHPEDRPIQFFSVLVPVHPADSRLEFVITPGPYGRNASDWTFWTDLEAATSR